MTERETIVVTDRGANSGMIGALVLVILLLIGIWFFVLGGNGGRTTVTNNNTSNDNPVPSLDVKVPTQPAAS